MRVLHHFEGGVVQPFEVGEGEITFDLRGENGILCVMLENAPDELFVKILTSARNRKMLLGQGLIASADERYRDQRPFPMQEEDGDAMAGVVAGMGNRFYLSTRYLYGVKRLAALCRRVVGPDIKMRWLRKMGRTVPVFEVGTDDGKKTVHYFIAGEDAWETTGSITADGMLRLIASHGTPICEMLDSMVIRVVPLLSPYSACLANPSYTTLDGKAVWATATWADDVPPPEISLVCEEIVKTVQEKRLGLMLNIHSWQGQNPNSMLEAIKTASNGAELDKPRAEWAAMALHTLIRDVPKGRAELAGKTWHPGVARDYMLGKHNAITFRLEVTTVGQGRDNFYETARALLTNMAKVADWSPVCG